MRQIVDEKLWPADIDAQPLVRAAAALRSVIRGYRDEIEREQRLPKALVEQFRDLLVPRPLVGLGLQEPMRHGNSIRDAVPTGPRSVA